VPLLRGDPLMIERMMARMVAAAVGLAGPTEVIAVTLAPEGGADVVLSVQRPERLRDRDEPTLLDPGYSPEGDWPDAPLLGLGFSLRLVRNLAAAAGGALLIQDARFVLRLPAASEDVSAGEA
jgi:hypothetical protein